MTSKRQNKYYIRSRISEKKFREILKYFSHDETALRTSIYTKINRNTVNSIFNKVRHRLLLNNQNFQQKEDGEFELDESYFSH